MISNEEIYKIILEEVNKDGYELEVIRDIRDEMKENFNRRLFGGYKRLNNKKYKKLCILEFRGE